MNPNKVTVIVFSKDRPMQLEAYIASLLAYSDICEEQIVVQYVPDASYDAVWEAFPKVRRVEDGGNFHQSLSAIVAPLSDDDLVFWGCDDIVFVREFSFAKMAAVMDARPDITGISVTLGIAMQGGDAIAALGAAELAEGLRGYSWKTDGYPSSWGYPFELSGTAYRAKLVRKILNGGWTFRGPNDLEAIGTRMLQRNRVGLWRRISRKLRGKPPVPGSEVWLEEARLAIFDQPVAGFSQDVNRVQDIALNPTNGTDEQDAERLKQLFREGWRLDWRSMRGVEPDNWPVGDRYWKLLPPAQ